MAAPFFETQYEDGTAIFRVHPFDGSSALLTKIFYAALLLFVAVFVMTMFVASPFASTLITIAIGGCVYRFRNSAKKIVSDSSLRSTPQFLEIQANSEGISAKGVFYPAAEIAELRYWIPGAPQGGGSSVGFAGTGAVGLGMAAGAAAMQGAFNAGRVIAAQRAARSCGVTLRTRSHSTPVVLVEGLTAYVAESLVKDLSRELGW
jgi:hypothetical protein